MRDTFTPFQRTIWLHYFVLIFLCIFNQSSYAESQLMERLITFKVEGTIERIDFAKANVYVSFEGPMYSTSIDPVTGQVSSELGPQLGMFSGAVVKFNVNPLRQAFNDGDFATFSCNNCKIEFNDGSELNPLLPGFPGDYNIPMEGRAFFGIGTVPTDEAGVMVIRGAGCGGTQEVAGKGELANGKGAICMNGGFTVTAIRSLQDLFRLRAKNIVFRGESDCTITMHVPVS